MDLPPSDGLPEDIFYDRCPQFIYKVWKAFFNLLGVTVSLSSGYHPQINKQMDLKIQEIICLPSDTATRTLGTSSWLGQNKLRTPCINQPLDSLLSSACSVTSHHCSHSPGNHAMFQQWITGLERVRESGTHNISSRGQCAARRVMLMPLWTKALTYPTRRYVSAQRTSSYACPAETSIQDTLAPSLSLGKSFFSCISCNYPLPIVCTPLSMYLTWNLTMLLYLPPPQRLVPWRRPIYLLGFLQDPVS